MRVTYIGPKWSWVEALAQDHPESKTNRGHKSQASLRAKHRVLDRRGGIVRVYTPQGEFLFTLTTR